MGATCTGLPFTLCIILSLQGIITILTSYGVIYSREFTHRVKSVSMAKFTTQEVRTLEQGGNQVKVHLELLYLVPFQLIGFKIEVTTAASTGHLPEGLGLATNEVAW
jgi:hypothetical protein